MVKLALWEHCELSVTSPSAGRGYPGAGGRSNTSRETRCLLKQPASANAYGTPVCISTSVKRKHILPIPVARRLVVAAVHLTLSVEHAPPVLRLELSLCIDVDLHLDRAALLAHREDGNVRRARQPADEQPADRRRAPSADLLARLRAELRQRDGLDHSALLTKLGKRRRLASRRHLVRQREEAALRIADNRNLLSVPEARVYGTRLRVRGVDPGDPDLLVGHHHLDT